MGIFEIADPSRIEALYAGWPETFIWSFLQGYMGFAWADHPCSPRAAKIMAGDFCLFAGKPNVDLILHRPKGKRTGCFILVPQNEAWSREIEQALGNPARRITRYATRKDPAAFDCGDLERFAALSNPTFSSGALMSCYSAFCRKVNGRTISAPNSRIMPIMSGGGSVWQRSIRVRRLPALPPIPFTGAALKLKLTHGWISAGRALPRHAAHG